MLTETLAVIPARLGSTRLLKKPLLKLCGKELILRVWEGVVKSALVDRVVVATDSEDIVRLVKGAGGEALMTPAELPTGSDRVAWVAERIPSRFVLNVQGDDPMVSPSMIDPMISVLSAEPEVNLAVLAKRIECEDEVTRDSIVKMVFDMRGLALYFSRSPIPFAREAAVYYKHIGPYAWRREALLEFSSWPRTPLEASESLEMLRMLEHGRVIKCVETDIDTLEIDTPEDVVYFEKIINGGNN